MKLITSLQIENFRTRIQKLLNGGNKHTYGFAPAEIDNILNDYEKLLKKTKKAQEVIRGYNRFIKELKTLSLGTEELDYDYEENPVTYFEYFDIDSYIENNLEQATFKFIDDKTNLEKIKEKLEIKINQETDSAKKEVYIEIKELIRQSEHEF